MPEVVIKQYTELGFWIQILSAAIFTAFLMASKKERLQKPVIFALKILALVAMLLVPNLLFSLIAAYYRPMAGIGSWLAFAIGVTAYAMLLCKYEKRAKMVVTAISISSIVIVNEAGAVFGIYMERTIEGFDSSIVKAIADFLLAAVAWFLLKHPVWKYYVSENATFLGELSNGLSMFVVITYDFFRVNVFGFNEDKNIMLLMTIVMLTLYMINSASYQMIYRLSREQTHVLDLQAERQMDKSAASFLAITEHNLNELHKINHDIQNQYTYMRLLLEKGSYDTLKDYFDELTGTFSEPLVPFVDCGNRVLDLIFNMENAKAKEAGINLDIKAVPPHELPFRDLDLCNLYANLMDNAIEACISEKIPDARVSVVVKTSGDYLYTQVMNPTKKEPKFLEKVGTTKENRHIHGKGMSIVKGIVKRYNGRYAARIENGMYYAEFFIDLTYKPEEVTK